MNMQILSIILYNAKGDKRVLEFKQKAVNIITGKSQTGKSSIVSIIDYCLGQSNFEISSGVISKTVEWYSVLCKVDDLEIFVAKPKPKNGEASQSESYLEIGRKINIPDMKDLIINSNDTAINIELSSRIGISENVNIPDAGDSKETLSAKFSHAKLLIFQPQSIVANKDTLFYKNNDYWIMQSVKTTLPYFLGIIPEDSLRLVNSLQNKQRDARKLEREISELEDLKITKVERGKSLLIEAQQVGLYEGETDELSFNDLISKLTPLKDWQPILVPPIVEDKITRTQEDLLELRRKFQEISDTIHKYEKHSNAAKGFVNEASEQEHRLESINLYKTEESTDKACLLCGSKITKSPEKLKDLEESLQKLDNDIKDANRELPELSKEIETNKELLEEYRTQIKQKEYDLNSLIDENKVSVDYRDTNTRISRVVGRISYYLDIASFVTDDDITTKRNKLSTLKNEITDLELKIDPNNLEDRKASILNRIGISMTELANKLEMEHKVPYRLDLKRLTVVADKPDEPVVMNRNMGSASNHLGSHLITLLSLHRYFIQNNRPVPSFLVLDQPTQVYFPDEKYKAMDGSKNTFDKDEDRLAVSRMFDLLFEISAETGLQIIVLEHANLDDEKFQNAIVDKVWRGDEALIPNEWLKKD